MFKVGDFVSVIHENIKGTITSINGKRIKFEDEDGFPREYQLKELAPHKPEKDYKLTDEQIERVINEQLDRQSLRLVSKTGTQQTHHRQESFEIDLHIDQLIDDYKFMDNSEIMMVQMRYCRIFIEKAIRLKVKKALLIHGKGEGVLKTEIHRYLDRIESNKHIRIDYMEINNGGATEVYL
jgi:dsDNA-specific endonuclease/ATPase MutS2